MSQSHTIVQTVISNPDFSTLVAAVTAAGLVETLQSAGPFTVFGPNNAAFAKLPAGTVESLVMPENKETLVGILTYHVVSGAVMAADLEDGQEIETVQGEKLTVMISDEGVMIQDTKGNMATVIMADLAQSNGVIHVIDTVLMPS